MNSKVVITLPNGETWTDESIETSYGDESLAEAVQVLRSREVSESVISDLVDQIREEHVQNGELNLTPDTTWKAAAEGVTLEITAS